MPQLNPEFFVSQLFWLVITFSFLILFLWRISLPRINAVLIKRETKINDDITTAKNNQNEAEEIQKNIEDQLRQSRLETNDLIKSSNFNFHEEINKNLENLDSKLTNKIEEASKLIQTNKKESFDLIQKQIYEITNLTLTKVSKIKVSESEIKDVVNKLQEKVIH